MTTTIAALQWRPYQSGAAGSLLAQQLFDAANDTEFRVPINAIFQNNIVTADGVIIDNTENASAVLLTIGNVLCNIPAFTREYLLLDKNAGLNIVINLAMNGGRILATFYRGTPPFNASVVNYYGVANAVVPNLSPITNSLVAPVPIVAGVYSTGPQLNQGPVGTWFASGTVTVLPTGGGDRVAVRLWDGTTVIDETVATLGLANPGSISVSGIIVFPVAGIRISVTTITNPGTILDVSVGGTTKCSTLSAFRTN